jgi:hypothetical protein
MRIAGERSFLKSTVIFTLALGFLLLPGPSFRAADTLPAQLSDEAYWKIIEDFSEDGGAFTSENFSSNERGYQALIPRLQAFVKPGSVYMGVGPEQNFQYIAALKPKMAFIIDIRRQNMIQHLMYKAAFEMSANRADFLSIIFSRKRPEGLSETSTPDQLFEAYQTPMDADLAETNRKAIKDLLMTRHGFKLTRDDVQTMDHVFDVFATFGGSLNYSSNINGIGRAVPGRGGSNNVAYSELMVSSTDNGVNRSYLANEESFRFLKEMHQKNLLIPLVGNFGGPKAIRAVGTYLKERGAIVGAFYLSNVEQYLFRPPLGGNSIHKEFYESVATLPLDESSMFIRSGQPPNRARGGGLMPMMSSILEVLAEFKAGRINTQADVLRLSIN